MRVWVRGAWLMWRALGTVGSVRQCRRLGTGTVVRAFGGVVARVESAPMSEAVRDVLVERGLCAPRSADWRSWEERKRGL